METLVLLWLTGQVFQDALQVTLEPAQLVLPRGAVLAPASWPRTSASGYLLTLHDGTTTLSVVP